MKISSINNNAKVLQGKNGYLFLDNDSNQVIPQITGKINFTDKQLFQWKLLLEMRSSWLKQNNIDYFFLAVPNKECVYYEHLPPEVNLEQQRCIVQLINYLAKKSSVKILYPVQDLIKARSIMETYRKGDTHWNDYGAYTCYLAMVTEISKSHTLKRLDLNNMAFKETTVRNSYQMDLGNKLGWNQDTTISCKLKKNSSKCIFDNNIKGTGKLYTYSNPNKNLISAVIFGDSFVHSLVPYLAESFSRLTVVQQPNIDYQIVENEQPNIVISEQVERFMIKIPDDIKGLSNYDFVHKKQLKETKLKLGASPLVKIDKSSKVEELENQIFNNNNLEDIDYANQAKNFLIKGNPEKSIFFYQKAITTSLKPKAWYYIGISDAYISIKDHKNALLSLQKAAELNPKKAEIFLKVGNIYYEKSNMIEAKKNYQVAYQLDPVISNKISSNIKKKLQLK